MKIAKWMITSTGKGYRDRRQSIRSGRKGTGKVLWSSIFWPDSPRSCRDADRLAYEISNDLRKAGWAILPVDGEQND